MLVHLSLSVDTVSTWYEFFCLVFHVVTVCGGTLPYCSTRTAGKSRATNLEHSTFCHSPTSADNNCHTTSMHSNLKHSTFCHSPMNTSADKNCHTTSVRAFQPPTFWQQSGSIMFCFA